MRENKERLEKGKNFDESKVSVKVLVPLIIAEIVLKYPSKAI